MFLTKKDILATLDDTSNIEIICGIVPNIKAPQLIRILKTASTLGANVIIDTDRGFVNTVFDNDDVTTPTLVPALGWRKNKWFPIVIKPKDNNMIVKVYPKFTSGVVAKFTQLAGGNHLVLEKMYQFLYALESRQNFKDSDITFSSGNQSLVATASIHENVEPQQFVQLAEKHGVLLSSDNPLAPDNSISCMFGDMENGLVVFYLLDVERVLAYVVANGAIDENAAYVLYHEGVEAEDTIYDRNQAIDSLINHISIDTDMFIDFLQDLEQMRIAGEMNADKVVSSIKVVSAVMPLESYTFYKFKGLRTKNIVRGNKKYPLKPGNFFGLRKTARGGYSLIIQETGAKKGYAITESNAESLVDRSSKLRKIPNVFFTEDDTAEVVVPDPTKLRNASKGRTVPPIKPSDIKVKK
jgi:hypothetical protein